MWRDLRSLDGVLAVAGDVLDSFDGVAILKLVKLDAISFQPGVDGACWGVFGPLVFLLGAEEAFRWEDFWVKMTPLELGAWTGILFFFCRCLGGVCGRWVWFRGFLQGWGCSLRALRALRSSLSAMILSFARCCASAAGPSSGLSRRSPERNFPSEGGSGASSLFGVGEVGA